MFWLGFSICSTGKTGNAALNYKFMIFLAPENHFWAYRRRATKKGVANLNNGKVGFTPNIDVLGFSYCSSTGQTGKPNLNSRLGPSSTNICFLGLPDEDWEGKP